ncbi:MULTISPECIES: SRPBCC family protein [unclassified Micromonospora]|uniref:SRPBCC family protein n=1 Tax=unclassified Micromonospora TaxID=2617518 RepID=UPI00363D0ACF
MDINRGAAVVVDLSTVVDAPLDTVWRLHTAIDAWPTWQHDIDEARLSGPVAVGSSFAWRTHGLSIVSTIGEVEPLRRIAWGGPAHGIDGVHVWTFAQTPAGVAVRTTESWDGPPVAADPDGMRAALTSSLTGWLAALRTAAESTT